MIRLRKKFIQYIKIKRICRENTVDYDNSYMNGKGDFPTYLYGYMSYVCRCSPFSSTFIFTDVHFRQIPFLPTASMLSAKMDVGENECR